MTQPTVGQRLRGLAAMVAILTLVAGVPFGLIAIGAGPEHFDLDEFRSLLSAPDDGTLAMIVIAAVTWIAWLVVAVSLTVEAVARLRGLTAPRLPGLGLPQHAASQLVTVAALLFVASPTVGAAFAVPPAHAAAAAAPPSSAPLHIAVEAAPFPQETSPLPGSAIGSANTPTVDYTVKRGDSLWKIADRLLGDGARFPEIVDLNKGVLNGRPDFIVAGTVLKVPDVAIESDVDRAAEEHVVAPGDTLSAIAETALGDPMRYPELFEASRDTVQPDGHTLTDPDLIRPGWTITIPPQGRHSSPQTSGPAPDESVPPVLEESPTETPSVEPTAEPSATAKREPERTSVDQADNEVESTAPSWLMPGLTGAGAVLAALVLLAVRAHRNTQLRYRRPGQTIASPPEELRAVEKTAFVAGAPLTSVIKDLDRALRHLAGACSDSGWALPQVAAATLDKGTVTLHLAADANLLEPWSGSGREWSLALKEPLDERGDVLPPYPLLVTVGRDEGGLHLVNLEHLGVLALTGDPERSAALARHIAAELALNPWSVLVDVHVIGLGEELAPLDTLRLRCHSDGEEIVQAIARDVSTSLKTGSGDPDPYCAVITAGGGTSELAPLLGSPTSRIGTVLVSLVARTDESTVFDLHRDGRLLAPSLGLDLQAAGLSSEEATACAAIVDLTRGSEPVKIAPFEQAADGWRALVDQSGALREELTDVRNEDAAGVGSLLPDATHEYAEVAATTAEDIETLAPVVPEQVRRKVESSDPTIDEDVAAWFDVDSKRPRLILLGPVNARAFGHIAPVITKRKPYFVEILAFLALHPEGVTSRAVADAFCIGESKARTDLSSLRKWLGEDPRTGELRLPAANKSPAYRTTGVKTYQVRDVLVDVDLFRRLRARGEARGAKGIDDLSLAMSLVSGIPFSLLRENGWSWLLDAERLHETIGCAIVDTAHVLVVDALAKGDLKSAHQIAEKACIAAPHDDICHLDFAKVIAAEGHEAAADKMLTDEVLNRSDDYLPPIDLPGRTREVVGKQGWGSGQRRPTG